MDAKHSSEVTCSGIVCDGLTIADVVRNLRLRKPFAFVKINHGLWERLVTLEQLQAAGIADARELENRSGQPPDWADGNFLHDLRVALACMPDLGADFFFSATPYAWPSSRRIEGTPSKPIGSVRSLIARYVPADTQNADGLIWKTSMYDGSFADVIEALRSRFVVLVGPHWLRQFGPFARLPHFTFVEIHESRARDDRAQICKDLAAVCAGLIEPVVLLSAGHVSPLIVIELLRKHVDATFLDVGVSLDICNISKIAARNWACVRRADVVATIEAIHPCWAGDERSATPGMTGSERFALWHKFSTGSDTTITDTIGLGPRRSNPSILDRADLDADRVPFVEPKTPDWSRIAEICMLSQQEERWANFGPVQRSLASVLHVTMGIPEDRVVVPASSATAALHAVVGMHAITSGRPLTWVVSAFGFPATAIGPLAGHVRVVDCDREGFLDLDRLAALEPDSWDGLIVTNVFGIASSFSDYDSFCRDRGKLLLIDSALAFEGARGHAVGADEVVSFHHTKPWGFGEGGCAIVARETAGLVRNLLNFGFDTDDAFLRFATNGKMSDLAAASILERLERRPSWSTFYRMQTRRVLNIALQAGLQLLGHQGPNLVRGHIAVLAPSPIDIGSLPSARFAVRKYYRPLAPKNPVAEEIYERIINVPCHPAMAAVPTGEMEDFFAAIRALKTA